MDSSPPGYRSFMLRIWREESKNDRSWRASLEDVSTGERLGYADLRSLCNHLWCLAGQPESAKGESSNDPTIF